MNFQKKRATNNYQLLRIKYYDIKHKLEQNPQDWDLELQLEEIKKQLKW